MTAEITTRKVGTKWHGYIAGRSDLDETALTEEAVRRKMEQLRARPVLPGVERLEQWWITPPLLSRSSATRSDRRRELAEVTRGHFQVSSDRKRATHGH